MGAFRDMRDPGYGCSLGIDSLAGAKRRIRFALALLMLCLASGSLAQTLSGVVVGVSDGDTITVLDADRRTHKIRLAGIDAPEKGQPFGRRSKESLSQLAYRQRVQVEWSKADRYGRIIGKILIAGEDVCLEQIRRGLAWHYKKYENEQPLDDRIVYGNAGQAAKEAKVGLWSDPNFVPPWEWRRLKRERRASSGL